MYIAVRAWIWALYNLHICIQRFSIGDFASEYLALGLSFLSKVCTTCPCLPASLFGVVVKDFHLWWLVTRVKMQHPVGRSYEALCSCSTFVVIKILTFDRNAHFSLLCSLHCIAGRMKSSDIDRIRVTGRIFFTFPAIGVLSAGVR